MTLLGLEPHPEFLATWTNTLLKYFKNFDVTKR